jgi:hypothetical protein
VWRATRCPKIASTIVCFSALVGWAPFGLMNNGAMALLMPLAVQLARLPDIAPGRR